MRRRLFRRIFPSIFVASVMIFAFINHQESNSNEEPAGGDRLDLHQLEASSSVISSNKTQVTSSITDITEVEVDMRLRSRHMKQVCHQNGLDQVGEDQLHKLNPWEYFINKDYHLVWCNVFKSGSSSWLYIFNRLAGFSEKDLQKKTRKTPPVTLARNYYGRPTSKELQTALQSSISFIVGRHPFERLISGYRDKIVQALRGSYHEKVGRSIIYKYRGVDVKRLGRAGLKMRPTFTEFVRYILDDLDAGVELDMHWTPVYSFCNPCQVNFTHIVKLETFERDQKYIIQQAKIGHLVEAHKENSAKDGKKSHEFMKEYLDELSDDLYEKILNVYSMDFQLFGYELPIRKHAES